MLVRSEVLSTKAETRFRGPPAASGDAERPMESFREGLDHDVLEGQAIALTLFQRSSVQLVTCSLPWGRKNTTTGALSATLRSPLVLLGYPEERVRKVKNL